MEMGIGGRSGRIFAGRVSNVGFGGVSLQQIPREHSPPIPAVANSERSKSGISNNNHLVGVRATGNSRAHDFYLLPWEYRDGLLRGWQLIRVTSCARPKCHRQSFLPPN